MRILTFRFLLALFGSLTCASAAAQPQQQVSPTTYEEKDAFRVEVPPGWLVLSAARGDPMSILAMGRGTPLVAFLGPHLYLCVEHHVDSSPADEYLNKQERDAPVFIEEESQFAGFPARRFTYYVKGGYDSGRTVGQLQARIKEPFLAWNIVILGKGEYWALRLRGPQKLWAHPRSQWTDQQLQAWQGAEQITQSFQLLSTAPRANAPAQPDAVEPASNRRFYWDRESGVRLELTRGTEFELRGSYGRLAIVGTGIDLAIVKAPMEASFEAAKDKFLAALAKDKAVADLSRESVELHGVSGTSIQFLEKSKSQFYRQFNVFLDHAGFNYLITAVGPQKEFDRHAAELRTIVLSAEFVDRRSSR